MASDSSSSSSPARKKKKKRTKEPKKAKKEIKKDVKLERGSRRFAKAETDLSVAPQKNLQMSPSASPVAPPRLGPARPDFVASGLLDGDGSGGSGDDAAPPRAGQAATAAGRNLAARSRSRDRGVPARGPLADAGRTGGRPGDFADGKGGGGKCEGGGKGKDGGKGGEGEEQAPKEEPNFEASGLLGLEDNSKNGVPLKFTAPAEARMPTMKWRIYIFAKQQDKPKIVHIHRLMSVLFGKDRRVVDIPTDHPTCSKQHAVMHHRLMPTGHVKPYIMDLESVNGTFLNGERLESARYYELREKDVLKFGMSSREFVLLHAGSANHLEIDPRKLLSDSE
mmetsp:Transcript_127932/g.370232  ORF Transcript_127932/g.370232 Transcript_127932/m.370232 type:complete len:337 (+) Transcript_127932:49-1059(+)